MNRLQCVENSKLEEPEVLFASGPCRDDTTRQSDQKTARVKCWYERELGWLNGFVVPTNLGEQSGARRSGVP